MDEKWAEHLEKKETVCHCGCGTNNLDQRIIAFFENIRSLLGNKPITVISGVRCKQHNKNVGGAPNSLHITGKALDIYQKGTKLSSVFRKAIEAGFTGVGIYPDQQMVHVDIRSKPLIWRKHKGKGYVYYPISEAEKLLKDAGYNA